MMKMNSYLNTLGLASRANKIVSGETLLKKIRSHDVKFVIIAKDSSENTRKKISDKCNSYSIDFVVCSSIHELSHAIGKNNRVAVGIIDSGFSKKIKEEIGG